MGLDERLDATRSALPGPDDVGVDVDAALGRTRAGIRRRRTRRQAAVAAVALVVVVAFGAVLAVSVPSEGQDVVAGDPDADDPEPTPPSTDVPPPGDEGPVRLWLDTRRVPVEGADLMTVLINEGADTAMFGVRGDVDRWEDGAWVHHRQVGFCHESCVGKLAGLDEEMVTILIGLGAEPGGVGPALGVRIEGLEPGWYRLRQGTNVTATGTFEVVDDDVDLVPHELDTTEDRLVVRPPLLARTGGSVSTYPVAPPGTDVRAIPLTDDVRIDTWDGTRWAEVTTTPGERSTGGIATVEVELPELPEGAYRAVRFLDDGTPVSGPFWVTDEVP